MRELALRRNASNAAHAAIGSRQLRLDGLAWSQLRACTAEVRANARVRLLRIPLFPCTPPPRRF